MWTPTGQQAIETLQAGQAILVFDQRERQVKTSRIYQVKSRSIVSPLVSIPSEGVVSTPDHLFFAQGHGWVAAEELDQSDTLVALSSSNNSTMNGTSSSSFTLRPAVKAVAADSSVVERTATGLVEVFNVFAEDTHTYFVGASGMLVHACMGMNIGPLQSADGSLVPSSLLSAASSVDSTIGGLHSALPSGRQLAVLDAYAPALSIVQPPRTFYDNKEKDEEHSSLWRPATLACVGLGDWAEVLGQRGDTTVVLDHGKGRLVGLSHTAMRSAVVGETGAVVCDAARVVVWTVELARFKHDGELSYTGTLGNGGNVYVTYFGVDLVEHYWVPSLAVDADGTNAHHRNASLVSSFTLLNGGRTGGGTTAVAVCGQRRDRLCVTHSGFKCEGEGCAEVGFVWSGLSVVFDVSVVCGFVSHHLHQLTICSSRTAEAR